MAKAKVDDTLEWVSLHETSRRIAERSAPDEKPLAAYLAALKFKNLEYPYRYRDGGVLHENDLSVDFLRDAVIDVAVSAATQPERIEHIPNPDLPLVRGDCTPQAQWISRSPHPFLPLGPFSRPYYLEKIIPAKTITDIEVLVPRQNEPSVAEPAALKAEPRTKHDRMLHILRELGLQCGMKPHKVRKVAHPAYKKRWKTEPPAPRTTQRAYEEYCEALAAEK